MTFDEMTFYLKVKRITTHFHIKLMSQLNVVNLVCVFVCINKGFNIKLLLPLLI